MRQSGILAAAGLFALEHHVERLAEDHARARTIAERLAEVCAGVAPAETNIVVVDLAAGGGDGPPRLRADEVVAKARAEGIAVSALGPYVLRAVTHLDVDDADCARAAEVLVGLLAQGT